MKNMYRNILPKNKLHKDENCEIIKDLYKVVCWVVINS